MDDLKIVIIDSDRERREEIVSYLPVYAEAVQTSFSKNAKDVLCADANGRFPDAVIMDADDDTNQGLYLFDLIRSGEIDPSIKRIPVILMTRDQFGDNCMDYLEIGDAVFYEGDPDEDRLFSTLIESLNEAEFSEDDKDDEDYLAYYLKEEKSIEKVLGTTLSAPAGEDGTIMRSAVLDMDSKLAGIEAVMESNMDKVSGTVKPLRVTNKIREDMGLPSVSNEEDIRNAAGPKERDSVIMDKLSQNEDVIARSKAVRERIRRQSEMLESKNKMFSDMRDLMLNNAGEAMNAQLGKRKLSTIVVIDDDPTVIANAKQFLSNRYVVVGCDSGMKAVDYFIREKADLIIIDAVLGNILGSQILTSIRWQQNGKSVPAIFMLGADYKDTADKLAIEGVVGVMQKPFSGTSLTMAVESVIK